MTHFNTAIIDQEASARQRLHEFSLTVDQLLAVGRVARTWANDASALMPNNAPGTLAYIYGVNELREQLLDGEWEVDRTCGIESVINRQLGVRVGFQNVDRACDANFPPAPRSVKGSAAENLCGPTLFEYAGVETGPLTGVKSDGVPTYYVMVGEDGSIELSHPVIANGAYKHFHERIFILSSDDDWLDEVDHQPDRLDEFEITVEFKENQ